MFRKSLLLLCTSALLAGCSALTPRAPSVRATLADDPLALHAHTLGKQQGELQRCEPVLGAALADRHHHSAQLLFSVYDKAERERAHSAFAAGVAEGLASGPTLRSSCEALVEPTNCVIDQVLEDARTILKVRADAQYRGPGFF